DANTVSSEIQVWHRLKSNNGEFSIEMPTDYSYFYDKDGFIAGKDSNSYEMREMQIVNSYANRTLMSVEVYRTSNQKNAIEAAIDYQNRQSDGKKLNSPGFVGREYNIKKDDWTRTTKYLASKTHLYIVTAATRNDDNQTFQRFLSSLKTGDNAAAEVNATPLGSLKISQPEISFEKPDAKKPADTKTPKDSSAQPEETVKLAIVGSVLPSYVEEARRANVSGTINLRLTFSPRGNISRIVVLRELPNGLLRQAVFSALRFKFLPQEKNGKPVAATKVVEFRFSIF
ncbi:MAG TPA: energy transducer TonB, partial [Pyrinomonadaceae bacterium]|nr:energy transducer TonB [Pyrinomonadaceae bacterium]